MLRSLVVVTAGLALAGMAQAQGDDSGSALSSAEALQPVVAAAGGANQQADDRLRALNDGMRANYARTLAQVSANIDPVIVVQFDGKGGTFNLRNGGTLTRVQPVPVNYELAKVVAHVPLDLYVILAPYLDAPAGGHWQVELAASGQRISDALASLDQTSLTGKALEDARQVLEASLTFVDDLLARRDFAVSDYMAYTAGIFEAVGRLRAYATEIQVRSVVAQLEAWRGEMGPERWYDLSAVVLAPYTLSGENAVTQALRSVMDPTQVNRRLITVGGDYGNDVDVAISVMARLFIDGLAARLVFAQEGDLGLEMTRSLSTSRDLMAVPTAEVLKAMNEERSGDQDD